jgi:outer membrane biosynthesis protein TonB
VTLSAPLRFTVEAAFLVAVGVALAAFDLELLPFLIVMGVAWVLVATCERLLSRPGVALSALRRRAPTRARESLRARRTREERPGPERRAERAPVTEPEPRAEPEPSAEPEPRVEPEPDAEPESPRVLEAVPTPEPEPEPEPRQEPEREEPVVELPQAAHRRPDGWNLWDLEQRAQQRAGQDPLRDEEWNALLVSLRDFARPDGTLPPEFDELVHESFAELISRRT